MGIALHTMDIVGMQVCIECPVWHDPHEDAEYQ